MDVRQLFAVAILIASPFCHAGHTGKIRFIGSVVESGCWQRSEQNEIFCPRNNAVTRYSIANTDRVSLNISNASVDKTFLDEYKHLELLTVVYN